MNSQFVFHLKISAVVSVALFAFSGCEKKADSGTSDSDAVASSADSATADSGEEVGERTGLWLRHAVFFSFKEDSSPEDVQGVVNAFADLPNKIDTIVDFQWGLNNSSEGKDDGFTHCFVLTFKTAADRDAYIPHPAHRGDFADVLRPHMKDVFVIDYWATPVGAIPDKPLQHAVFVKFKDDAAAGDVARVEDAFAALPSKIDQIKAFEWGLNNSPEKNDDGFTHCFMVTFDSEEGRQEYVSHPAHKAFGKELALVLDKARVLDFWDQ